MDHAHIDVAALPTADKSQRTARNMMALLTERTE
jgi:hypothetical protein